MSEDESARPWGHYEVLSDGPDFKTKTITVRPGKRLSCQRHAHRSEHWFAVKGTGTVTLEGPVVRVEPGVAVDVPVGVAHRIENTHEAADLVFVEVQHGDCFGEDEIVRLEDDYGRSGLRPIVPQCVACSCVGEPPLADVAPEASQYSPASCSTAYLTPC